MYRFPSTLLREADLRVTIASEKRATGHFVRPPRRAGDCMDFELPEDIRLLRETVRKFVDRELIPIEMHSMEGPELKPEYKPSLEAKARELGLWQLDTPAEFGGQGLSPAGARGGVGGGARSIALPNRGDGVFGPSPRPILLRLPEKMKEKYLHPAAARREVRGLRPDRAGRRQRSRPHADARRPAGRSLRHQRLQALHLARQGRGFPAACRRHRSGEGLARRALGVHRRHEFARLSIVRVRPRT